MRKTTKWMTMMAVGLTLATAAQADPQERGYQGQSNAVKGKFVAGGGLFGQSIDDAQGHKIAGEVVFAGRGCPGDALPEVDGKVALFERGGCVFTAKVAQAQAAGAAGVLIYNDTRNGDNVVAMGAPAGFNDTLGIPSALVGRSQGMALRSGKKPVTVQIKDKTRDHLETRED
jgi:hypothetical protein